MENLFQNAKWISFESNARGKKNKVNPWENVIDSKVRKMDIEKGSGIPVFHKRFKLRDGIKRCTIHLTALGCFNLYMNGQKIGTDELMPGWTDYEKRVLYYTYDVTDVAMQENVVAVPVSSGWWAGRISLDTYGENDTAFICVIETEYQDGEKETICSDLTWRGTTAGPVRYADLWDGEVYNANYDSYEKISLPDYPKSKTWKIPYEFKNFKGVISPKVGPSVKIRDFLVMKPKTVVVYDRIDENETDFGTIHILKKLEDALCTSVLLLKKGETVVYDMGQNMVGWEHFTVKGNQNTTVTLRHAEMLNDSGKASRGNDGPEGTLYTSNYRSAKAKGRYTLSGDENGEEYRPSFTFYGFRYVEISADDDIEILAFRCDVVGSDNKETGFIETSNKDVNQLFSNILWGQRGNYLSVPTDCPQRDERLGWTGDTQVFACTAAYNANVCSFFHKWLQDARDSQKEYGAYTDVIPRSRVVGEGGAAWSDAGIIVPYTMYKMYGDLSILEECYSSMLDYMDYLSVTNLEGPHPTYGDWLAYEPTEARLICIAYYAYDALLVSKMSAALSKKAGDEYEEKAEEYYVLYTKIKSHFQKVYLDANGKLKQTSQTAYLLALKFDLLPEEYREEARKELAAKLVKNGYRLSTGFVGSAILNQTLSEIGESNLAYSLLLQKENPSWLYSIYQGATTIWERWNSYTKESGFGDVGMNSFNHYAYGAVAEWMYKYMAGIETDEKKPGFKHIIFQPKPDLREEYELPYGQERIKWVRACFESVSGPIEAAWYMEEDTFAYIVSIPKESYATLYLPVFDKNAKTITVDGRIYPVDTFPTEKGCIVLYLPSGRHQIEALR